jgi:5-hydroxytryptamine receptor 4
MKDITYVHPRLITFTLWLAWGNSACNPVIYAAFNQSFRKAFKRSLGCN